MPKQDIEIVKANGQRESFVRAKLETSLYNAGGSPEVVEKITDTIEAELEDGMSTRQIYERAHRLLEQEAKQANACRYSMLDAVMEFGPSGYPFERFVARLLEDQGYTTQVSQVLPGRCVEHEVDVVAHKNDELLLIEAKFHNRHGTTSDTQAALAARARFDDLSDQVFDGLPDRPMSQAWLVTNTKFTASAARYGECTGLKLIGWNYPDPKTGLQAMIENSNLQPLTCLSSLSHSIKSRLLKENIVLCATVRDQPEMLREYGLSEEDINRVTQEIDDLQASVAAK